MNWKVVSSISVAVLAITGIVSYDLVIKEKAFSTEVVVAKERIGKHTEFSRKNLVIERRSKDDLVKGYIKAKDIDTLYGLDSNSVIPENQMLSKEFVEYENLTPDPSKDEMIRPLPADWIYAMPGSLRRKDMITIYPVKDKDQQETQQQQGIRTVDDEQALSKEDADNATPAEVASRFAPILKNVTVSYVKTSSNKEVMNEDGSTERLNGSGTATDIEVNISEEQLKKIVQYIDQGYKLYISYR